MKLRNWLLIIPMVVTGSPNIALATANKDPSLECLVDIGNFFLTHRQTPSPQKPAPYIIVQTKKAKPQI